MSTNGVPWDDLPGAKIWPTQWATNTSDDNATSNDLTSNSTASINTNNINDTIATEWKKDTNPFMPKIETDPNDTVSVMMKHAEGYARRIGFGACVGGLTGFAFAGVDILKDVKLMTSAKSKAGIKLKNYTGLFAGYFTAYQILHHTASTYTDLPPTVALGSAAAGSIIPLVMMGRYRGMIPYAVVLVGLDAFNLYQDGMLN